MNDRGERFKGEQRLGSSQEIVVGSRFSDYSQRCTSAQCQIVFLLSEGASAVSLSALNTVHSNSKRTFIQWWQFWWQPASDPSEAD